ncbi:MAG: DUF2807 domain-containing protein [Bacteroidales bacterium]|nr:DUF2807 domain-containing protein [Bacteroidales bacterium]
MKKHISLLAATALLALLPSCRFIKVSDELIQEMKDAGMSVHVDSNGETIEPSDNLITRDEVTGEYRGIQISLPCDMTYTPGDCALSLHGPDNVLSHISVNNENGTLVIKSDGVNFKKLKNLRINASSQVLESLVFNGAVDFEAPQGITALDFEATVNGAGDIDIQGLTSGKATITVNGAGDATIAKADCDHFTLAINGAGDATVSGRAGKADLTISGAGDIDARGLKAEEFNSRVRGIGKIQKPKE